MLQITNLSVAAEGKQIIKNLDLEINPGEVVVLMGPNGSGKSTLAYALAGDPRYSSSKLKDKRSNIELDGKDLTNLAADERSKAGLFLVNQYPVAIPGLSSISYLWQLYKKHNPTSKTLVSEFRKWIGGQAEALGLDAELLKRGLNDGFSGGEKKKMEILQLLVSNPHYILLDEVDSGLDVDALKKIATTVAKMAKEQKMGIMLITHYSRILQYITADKVIIMRNGVIEKTGGLELVTMIEKEGFGSEEANL